MKKIEIILKKYFDTNTINIIFEKLKIKQRASAINENYFTKVGINTNKLFFNNLITEINFYSNNSDNQNLPCLIDSYIDSNVCVLVLKKIKAKTIGEFRNQFNLYLSDEKRNNIIQNILNIKDINVNGNLDSSYNRKERLDKYLKNSQHYISKSTINKIYSKYNFIIKEEYNRVIAHGDLICTNIMLNNDKVYFIDWEFISMKPLYYDLAYFLLFSKTHNSLEILKKYGFYNEMVNFDELCKDAIIICLKEIQNNAKLFGKLDNKLVNKNIRRWKSELNIIMKYYLE